MMLTAAFALSLIVNVSSAPQVPEMIVTDALAEANAIWRQSDMTFTWRRGDAASAAARLRVVIGFDTTPSHDAALPLGWVVFDDDRTPQPEIHLSYTNAQQLFDESRGQRNVTRLEHDVLIARALGRALAHELGHYLLASKAHTPSGLMQATRSAMDFFGPYRAHYEITAAQRSQVAARLRAEPMIASR
jgi:hypothetical protein